MEYHGFHYLSSDGRIGQGDSWATNQHRSETASDTTPQPKLGLTDRLIEIENQDFLRRQVGNFDSAAGTS
jgi:hypothetical protein